MKRILVAAFALALVFATPAPTAAYTVIESGDQTGNGYADVWTIDTNGDGWADEMIIDANENGRVEISLVWTGSLVRSVWFDTNEDGVYDSVLEPYYANNGAGALAAKMLWVDFDQNGLWERRFYDADLDGYYEWVEVDTNYDGSADQWVGNAAPAGHTAVDDMARRASASGAIDILSNLGFSPFNPVSTIPLGG